MPKVWTDDDRAAHLTDCSDPIEISTFGDAQPRIICGCKETSRHTPLAVAWAEIDAECLKVRP